MNGRSPELGCLDSVTDFLCRSVQLLWPSRSFLHVCEQTQQFWRGVKISWRLWKFAQRTVVIDNCNSVSYFNGDIILMQWYLCRLYCWEIQTLGELCNVSWEFGVYPLIIFFFLMQLFEVWCLPDNLVWLFIAIFMPWKYAGVRWGMLDHVLW